MNTSGFSSHTPGTEVIKWAWLDIFHLTDVFDVVLVSHPLRPPTQLRWYLKRACVALIVSAMVFASRDREPEGGV